MNRRLILTGLVATVLGCGLVAPALAEDPEPQRQKLCVKQATIFPDGYCVVWDKPLGQDR